MILFMGFPMYTLVLLSVCVNNGQLDVGFFYVLILQSSHYHEKIF